MLSVGRIYLEDRLCTSKKVEIGGSGRAQSQSAVHMVAVLAGYRKVMVHMAGPSLSSTNRQKPLSCLCRGSISGFVGSFWY